MQLFELPTYTCTGTELESSTSLQAHNPARHRLGRYRGGTADETGVSTALVYLGLACSLDGDHRECAARITAGTQGQRSPSPVLCSSLERNDINVSFSGRDFGPLTPPLPFSTSENNYGTVSPFASSSIAFHVPGPASDAALHSFNFDFLVRHQAIHSTVNNPPLTLSSTINNTNFYYLNLILIRQLPDSTAARRLLPLALPPAPLRL